MPPSHLVLLGPPGAGKGTQSALLYQHYSFRHVSIGEILRQQAGSTSPQGIQMAALLAQGKFVDDQLIITIVEQFITSHPEVTGWIWDGFPRTVAQAQHVLATWSLTNRKPEALYLDLPLYECHVRLLQRSLTSNRTDDQPEIIERRFQEYQKLTLPI